MCGITGLYHPDRNVEILETLVRAMRDSLTHRGPDDAGLFVGPGIGLGHRRLSIIDLSEAGRNPLWNEDRTRCIIFNGEIYNHRDLRSGLESKYRFHSQTDTEVILHGYSEYGPDVLQRLNGMFAFAIYDTRTHELFVARDRMGIKPFFYAFHEGRFVFGSEVKAVLEAGIPRRVNLRGISSYLSYRYVLGTETLFDGIHSLEPGHYAVLRPEGAFTPKRYWDVPLSAGREDHGEAYYTHHVRGLLSASVRRRLMSDVPFGAYLSGGLDSSIVVALMSQLHPEPVKTFSIGFEEADFNEFAYARQVATRFKTDHHEILLKSTDYFDEMERLIRFRDAPLGVPNEVPLHLMSRELKKHITVVLSGEGADELFAGYGRMFRSAYDYQRLTQTPDILKKLLFERLYHRYGQWHFDDPLSFFLERYGYWSLHEKTSLFTKAFMHDVDHDAPLRTLFQEKFERASALSMTEQMLYVFQHIHLLGLLMRVDATTMATAVEARVPFVDHELVEFVFRMPSYYKVRWNSLWARFRSLRHPGDTISERWDTPKYILRRAFEQDLPRDILTRKKVGFPVPLTQWLNADFHEYARDLLLSPSSRTRNYFDPVVLESWLADSSKPLWGQKVWMLINLELWHRAYI